MRDGAILRRDETSNVIGAGFDVPLVQLRDVACRIGAATPIAGLTLSLREGRRTVILGPNGAGKSLALRLMHGLVRPSAGQVLWRGRPLDAAARGDQAMVFQRPVMLRRSVLANLAFALKVRGFAGREGARRADEALEMAGLAHAAHRPAGVLSGGEQQRLALARALATAPRLLFLDEPTAHLDPASTQRIEALIEAAHARGVTIVLVTHDKGQARRLGQDAIFLQDGRVAEAAPAATLLSAPESPAARAWVSGELFLPTS